MRTTLVEVFRVLVGVAVPLAAFTTGLQAPPGKGGHRLWAQPGLFARALVAVLVLVPLWGLVLVRSLPLDFTTQAGLMLALLAVGIGPFASMKNMKDTRPYAREALDLNLTVLITGILFVPVTVKLVAALFHRHADLGVGQVAGVVLGRALLPLLVGLVAARLWPRIAALAGPRLAKIANVMMVLLLVVVVAAKWRDLVSIGAMGWLACLAAAVGAIAIGHTLGGPDRGTRAVVASSSAMRFPALGLMLAQASAQPKRLVPVVAAYALVAAASVALYDVIRARARARSRSGAGAGSR